MLNHKERSETMKVDIFKEAMANYPTGISIVTSNDEQGNPIGLTVNSFASVSLDPLLILWSIDNRVSTYKEFKKADKFAVNILANDQAEIAKLFASSLSNQERFEGCDWNSSANQLPIIKDAVASLQCKTFQQVQAGDHIIFIGEVIEIEIEKRQPLLYHRRKMGGFPESFHES